MPENWFVSSGDEAAGVVRAIMVVCGFVYEAELETLGGRLRVDGRRLRPIAWAWFQVRLAALGTPTYKSLAAAVRELDFRFGASAYHIYDGAGGIAEEFLRELHERTKALIPEDRQL